MARTVPVSVTETPGNSLTAALWNAQVKATIDFLTSPPRFKGYATVAQSIPNNAFTSLSLDAELWDSDGGHSTVSATSRYVCQVAGTYAVVGAASIVGNATGGRGVQITVNGNAITGTELLTNNNGTGSWSGQTVCEVPLNVGDYVEVQAYQNSGGALNTNNFAPLAPAMTVRWVSA